MVRTTIEVEKSLANINTILNVSAANLDKFKNFGGDMENLFHKSKLVHSMRALNLDPKDKKQLTMEDINTGLTFFIQEKEEKEEPTQTGGPPETI